MPATLFQFRFKLQFSFCCCCTCSLDSVCLFPTEVNCKRRFFEVKNWIVKRDFFLFLFLFLFFVEVVYLANDIPRSQAVSILVSFKTAVARNTMCLKYFYYVFEIFFLCVWNISTMCSICFLFNAFEIF